MCSTNERPVASLDLVVLSQIGAELLDRFFLVGAEVTDQGHVGADGAADPTISTYLEQGARRAARRQQPGVSDRVPVETPIEITTVRFRDEEGAETHVLASSRAVTVDLEYETESELDPVAINFTIFRADGVRCLDAPTDRGPLTAIPKGKGVARLRFPSLGLTTGSYRASISVSNPDNGHTYLFHDQLHPFTVRDHRQGLSLIWIDYDWQLKPAVAQRAKSMRVVKGA